MDLAIVVPDVASQSLSFRREIDAAMLAWQARLDVLAKGASVKHGGGRVIVLG